MEVVEGGGSSYIEGRMGYPCQLCLDSPGKFQGRGEPQGLVAWGL